MKVYLQNCMNISFSNDLIEQTKSQQSSNSKKLKDENKISILNQKLSEQKKYLSLNKKEYIQSSVIIKQKKLTRKSILIYLSNLMLLCILLIAFYQTKSQQNQIFLSFQSIKNQNMQNHRNLVSSCAGFNQHWNGQQCVNCNKSTNQAYWSSTYSACKCSQFYYYFDYTTSKCKYCPSSIATLHIQSINQCQCDDQDYQLVQQTCVSISSSVSMGAVIAIIMGSIVGLIFTGVCIKIHCYWSDNSSNNIIETNNNIPKGISQQQYLNLIIFNDFGPQILNPCQKCCICLDQITNISTYCSHMFHVKCMAEWIRQKSKNRGKPTCPVCVGQNMRHFKLFCSKCLKPEQIIQISSQTSLQTLQKYNDNRCQNCKVYSNQQQLVNTQKHFIDKPYNQDNQI